MAAELSTCAVCKQKAYRDEYGRMMMHTRSGADVESKPIMTRFGPMSSRIPSAEVCPGSDRGAKPNSARSERRR